MEIRGNTWKYVEMPGNTWKYVEIRGNAWKCMEMHGNIWKYMEPAALLGLIFEATPESPAKEWMTGGPSSFLGRVKMKE
ncbi:MAG: hypothetical protein KDD10_27555 [Phaeodactylibacter sp.]|nr:hypothetical protein [Phaeodactylibacter sp.]MCB9292081.1 hypothetical protein [Lewinellaceae bacterium]